VMFRILEKTKRTEECEHVIDERNRSGGQDQILGDRENLLTPRALDAVVSLQPDGRKLRPSRRTPGWTGSFRFRKREMRESMLPPREILA
jgi:hypothetical protein